MVSGILSAPKADHESSPARPDHRLVFTVLVVAFASFAGISDLGFQRSIETTMNDASRANLESIQRVLARTAAKGIEEVKKELDELDGVWAGAALLEISDADGRIIFQSERFQKPYPTLPPTGKGEITILAAGKGIQVTRELAAGPVRVSADPWRDPASSPDYYRKRRKVHALRRQD